MIINWLILHSRNWDDSNSIIYFTINNLAKSFFTLVKMTNGGKCPSIEFRQPYRNKVFYEHSPYEIRWRRYRGRPAATAAQINEVHARGRRAFSSYLSVR